VIAAPSINEDAYRITLPASDAGSVFVMNSSSGELVAPLRQGQPAPFPGVLFNGPATARVEVEFRGQQARCLIDRQADIDRVAARAVTDIRLLQVTLNTNSLSYNLMLRSRDEEIQRLYEQLITATRPASVLSHVLTGASSFVLGFGVGLPVGLLLR